MNLHCVNYKKISVLYIYFDSFDINLHFDNYSTYHMKGSLDIQRFVVCIKFRISLKACILGLHFLVLFRGLCTLPFPFGFSWGIIWPPGVGLKKDPFFGFDTIKSVRIIYIYNIQCIKSDFNVFDLTVTVLLLYCTILSKSFDALDFTFTVHVSFQIFWLTSVVHRWPSVRV